MKKKFLVYAATALAIFAFPPVKALPQENLNNSKTEITEEQHVTIDELLARVEGKYEIVNQKKRQKNF